MTYGRLAAWCASLLAHALAAAAVVHAPASAPRDPPPLMDLVMSAPEPAEVAAAPDLEFAPSAPAEPATSAPEPDTAAAAPHEPVSEAPPEALAEAEPDTAPAEEMPPLQEPPPPPPPVVAAAPPPPPVTKSRPTPTRPTPAAVPPAAMPPTAPVAAPRPVAPPPTWLGQISAALARHHSYPARLRAQRAAGVVMVRFSLDRDGKVMSRRVERSSGNAELDRLALELLGRADPLPPPPPDMPGA